MPALGSILLGFFEQDARRAYRELQIVSPFGSISLGFFNKEQLEIAASCLPSNWFNL